MAARMADLEYNKRKQWLEDGFHWCTKCEQKLHIKDFGASKAAMFGYNSWCKSCHSKFRKGNKKIQERSRLRARSFIGYYKKLLGGKCAKCEYSKSQVSLEFHHVNKDKKENNLSPLISKGAPHEEIYYEIDKCILLCRNCHMEIEATIWDCEFVKIDIGYSIKEGSVVEFLENCWINESYAVKHLVVQASLLGSD